MTDTKQKCTTPPRATCPGGCFPGQCLNASCTLRLHHPVVLGRPDIEREAEFRRQCIEIAKKDHKDRERLEFLKDARKKMGMGSFLNMDDDRGMSILESPMLGQCPEFDIRDFKTSDGALKPMREPARPSCMLAPPPFTPPTDDYNDLSRFLRISTMPGYNSNDQVSEYHDNHNMAVWNNRKDIDPQAFKMKRDWLSVWGEFNVKEQCWRKAWAEKFGV